MNVFSQDYEAKLLEQNLTAFNRFLEVYQQPKPRVLGLITAEQVKEELNIKGKTLKRWENAGLKRYQPPLEDTRKIITRSVIFLSFWGWMCRWLFMKQEALALICTPTKDN